MTIPLAGLRYFCLSHIASPNQLRYPGQLEIVGSIESGVKCAKWSPDDDLLVLVTGSLLELPLLVRADRAVTR